MSSTTSTTESRALSLLGQGIGPEMVASAVGVSVSRISQLLSDPEFSSAVAELRFKNLSAHNDRDRRYDSLEDKLIDKMEDLIPFMMKPLEVLRAISVINAAKRRGASAPESITQQNTVVNLLMPTQITQIFSAEQRSLTLNTNNQVVSAGGQDLVTVQSGRMDALVSAVKGQRENVQITHTPTTQTSGENPTFSG